MSGSARRPPRVVIASICFLFAAAVGAVAAEEARSVSSEPFPHAPAWVANQTLYEVNLRQFSAEGTIDGFRRQLPRLKKLGVGTLWFMPTYPIGMTGRSGKLGSPYAVADYTKVNPEFGTLEQLKIAVSEAHAQGMHVILDWVAAHTALDHPWIALHPDWYKHDAAGKLVPPLPSWRDVAGLNYDVPALRQEMIADMAYWVRTADVDGFRCDSAEFVPLDFWCEARNSLRRIKPVFLLAEGSKPELLNYAFDAAYAWSLPDNTQGIVKGTKNVQDLVNYFQADARLLSGDGFRLNFTTNHDKNAWEGTTTELLDGGTDAFTVLTFTVPGMALIYNGQEGSDERRLTFFDRDPITWRADPRTDLYRTLAELKRTNRALWTGPKSAAMHVIAVDVGRSVLSFDREIQGDRVVVLLNLSPHAARVPVPANVGGMKQVLGSGGEGADHSMFSLPPWGYCVWSRAR